MPLANAAPGDLITSEDWNALVAAYNSLDTRVTQLEAGGSRSGPTIVQVLPTGTRTAGETIHIFGSNFDFTKGGTSVFFGSTRASSFADGSSDSLLIVKIPDLVEGTTAEGAPITVTVSNLVAFTTWALTIKSKPIDVGGGIEFGYQNSVPDTPMATKPILFNFKLVSLSNADLTVTITPELQFPGAAAGLLEVRDDDGLPKKDGKIQLLSGKTKTIGVKITAVPDVPAGTAFGLRVTASAPGMTPVSEDIPPQKVGQAGEIPDPTITNLTWNSVLDGNATPPTPPGAGDSVDGIITIPGKDAATVTIALDTTFANIPAGSTFHYKASAAVISGAGWKADINALVTPADGYAVPSPGQQQFPGFDINAPANSTPAVIQFTLTRQEAATNNRRSVTYRFVRT